MFPLLVRDGLALPYSALQCFYLLFGSGFVEAVSDVDHPRLPVARRLATVSSVAVIGLCTWIHAAVFLLRFRCSALRPFTHGRCSLRRWLATRIWCRWCSRSTRLRTSPRRICCCSERSSPRRSTAMRSMLPALLLVERRSRESKQQFPGKHARPLRNANNTRALTPCCCCRRQRRRHRRSS
jgi:hypothetical protein